MPCSDSSSSIALKLDKTERFVHFEFAKITCGREITADTGFNAYLKGKTLQEILDTTFSDCIIDLKVKEEDDQFILYMEWDALRSSIAQYLGIEDDSIDRDRCQITAIEHTDEGIEVAQVILPPKEMPKILPCSLGDQ